jgi:hypothetical protein
MKTLIYIFFVLLFLTGCSRQANVDNQTIEKSKTIEDSLKSILNISDSIKVLKFEKLEGEHEYIFIDYNRNSEYYKPLEDEFKLAEYYSETIKERLSEFSNYKNDSIQLLINKEFQHLLGIWIPLHQLDNELFVVNSNDFQCSYTFTDTLFYDGFYQGGPEIYFIENVEKINSKKTHLKLRTFENRIIEMDFYQVDSKGTYLNVTKNKWDEDYISYMTKNANARSYNLVQHLCSELAPIYEFDKPDYQKILNELNN